MSVDTIDWLRISSIREADGADRTRYPTEAEYAARNRTQIVERGARTSTGSTTLYTVPAGKVLYITYVWLAMYENDAGKSTIGSVDYNPGGSSEMILSGATGFARAESSARFHLVLPLPMPITLEATRIVQFGGIAGGDARIEAGFAGWIEDA